MTYATDIDDDRHRLAYYLAFDGIDARLATHDLNGLIAGTYIQGMMKPQASGTRFDRGRGIIMPGGMSVQAQSTPAVIAYFARRGGTEARLTASITRSTVTIPVGTPQPWPNGTFVYCERETIELGFFAAGSYLVSTRGRFGSQLRAHPITATVSDVPRYWKGRRAQLFAVNLDTGSRQAIRTAKLTASPRFEDGSVSLDFVDLTTELSRPIFSGWFPQSVAQFDVNPVDFGEFALEVADGRAFVDNASNSFFRLRYEDRLEVYELSFGDVGATTLNVIDFPSKLVHSTVDGPVWAQLSETPEADVMQVGFIEADPAIAALMVMLSNIGDGSEGVYDVLPGVVPGDSDVPDLIPRRIGAGLPADFVDIPSWEAAEGFGKARFFIEEKQPLIDFLVDEILWRLGGFVFVNDEGKIAFQRYNPATPDANLPDFQRDDLVSAPVVAWDDEGEIVSQATIDCNYNHDTRTFRRQLQANFLETVGTYEDQRASVDLQSKSLWVGNAGGGELASPPVTTELGIIAMLDRQFSRTRNGVNRTRLLLPWRRHLELPPAGVFNLTDPRMPDGDGGVGVVSRRYQAMEVNPDYESGRVEVVAEEVPRGFLIAPAFIIGSVGGGGVVLTADTTGEEADLFDSDAAEDFASGWTVRIFDKSASPPFSTSGIAVVSGTPAGNVLTIGAAPFALAAGDLVKLGELGPTGFLSPIGADTDDYLFMVGVDGKVGSGGGERDGSVWS